MTADVLVHQRLGEARLVAFIVAEAAIAPHVDHDRALELHAEFGRNFRGEHHRFRVVAIDVEDRRFHHLRHVGGIGRGARIARIGGETDLVVDDEMHRATRAVALEAREAKAFRHDALAREGRIAMQQQRQNRAAIIGRAAMLVLLRADLAQHHRVDDFKVRGVRRERQMDVVAIESAIGRRAEMVFHIARAFHVIGREGAALELVEQSAMRLAHHLGEHIETAAMGHAQHDILHPEIAAALDDLLKRGDEALAAIQAEALGAGELHIEELLEALGLHQLVQDGALALAGKRDLLVRTLDALLQPALRGRIGDVHELVADGFAVGAAQDRQHLADRREFEAQHVVDEDLAIPIRFREAVGRGVQFLVVLARLHAERVEVRMQMPAHAIGADHHQGMDGIARGADEIGLRERRRTPGDRSIRLALQLVRDDLLDRAPIAVQRRDQLAIDLRRPVLPRPGGAGRLFAGEAFEIGRVARRKRREINSAFVIHGSVPVLRRQGEKVRSGPANASDARSG